MMNNDQSHKFFDDFMYYLKTLSNDALLWVMLCIAAESKRRTM